MWVTKERWLEELRLKEEPPVLQEDGYRLYYGFTDHWWEAVSIYDFNKYAFPPQYFGIVLVCDPQTGLPKHEISIQAPDTPGFEGDGLELAEFRYYSEAYHHVWRRRLIPARVIEARIFARDEVGLWSPSGLRRNVHSFEGEEEWFPADDLISRHFGRIGGPKILGYVLEEGVYRPFREGRWIEDMRHIYEGNRLNYDSEAVQYLKDEHGIMSQPLYLEGDEGKYMDLSKVPLTLGKARVIRF